MSQNTEAASADSDVSAAHIDPISSNAGWRAGITASFQGVGGHLALIVAVAAIVVGVAIGIASFMQASKATHDAIDKRLEATLEGRSQTLSAYLRGIEEDIRILREAPFVHRAVTDFATAWRAIPGDRTAALQKLYIADNPNPTGKKEDLDAAGDGSAYSRHHAAYHPWFRSFQRARLLRCFLVRSRRQSCLHGL